MFNKKFNDKYPDVRKPIICNGLKAIIPYRHPRPCLEENAVEEIPELDANNQAEPIIPPEDIINP